MPSVKIPCHCVYVRVCACVSVCSCVSYRKGKSKGLKLDPLDTANSFHQADVSICVAQIKAFQWTRAYSNLCVISVSVNHFVHWREVLCFVTLDQRF